MAFSQVAWRSTKASQAANERAAFDVGTQPRAACLQDLEKTPLHIAAECREELRSWDRGKDAVTGVRRDHSGRDIFCEMPMGAIPDQVFIVAKDDAGGIAAFDVGPRVDKLCNGGLPAVGSDYNIGANRRARPTGIFQSDADDPTGHRELQLGKNNAMADFS